MARLLPRGEREKMGRPLPRGERGYSGFSKVLRMS
jgi:hypothetical protein